MVVDGGVPDIRLRRVSELQSLARKWLGPIDKKVKEKFNPRGKPAYSPPAEHVPQCRGNIIQHSITHMITRPR
jgi:hypothetical protein